MYPLQAAAAYALFWFIRFLSFESASRLGGWFGRTIGPLLQATSVAKQNLRNAFPEKPGMEVNSLVSDMWDNMGRTLFEFPHIDRLKFYENSDHIEVVGAENIDRLNKDGRPGIFYTAHLANWELAALAIVHRGLPLHVFYRKPNNKLIENLYHKRRPENLGVLPKGSQGARNALTLLKKGEHLGMLLDQKMNDGIAVPFFGRDVMTAPAIAQFALKYQCPLVPTCVERLAGAKFRITFYPPEEYTPSGDQNHDIQTIMTNVNGRIEGWIRQNPCQWLWVHKRWPDE